MPSVSVDLRPQYGLPGPRALLRTEENERGGYVPHVVYACGALLQRFRLILPYGISDSATKIVSIDLEELLSMLTP